MIKFFKDKEVGFLYFYIHFICEVTCFFVLSKLFNLPVFMWTVALFYDAFAFVPQSIFGYISDKFPNFKLGLIGLTLLIIATLICSIENYELVYIVLLVLCVGNCLIHVEGAETTLRSSNGKMSNSGIFVGGGSFGVITGKIFAEIGISYYAIIVLIISAIPFVLYATYFKNDGGTIKPCINFNYHNKNINPYVIVLLAVLVVIVRGYMGYGIPTTWRKSLLEKVIFYFAMGFGKCLGGILIDKIGIRKTSFISMIFSIPFLIFGDNLIYVSLIGVAFFSMSMAITLAILVSILPLKPGLAFGLTTIGLFLGSAPIFVMKITSVYINVVMIVTLSILCFMALKYITNKDDRYADK